MAKFPGKIENLLRTNTALLLLCIISIGVLFLLIRHDDAGDKGSDIDLSAKKITIDPTQATEDDLASEDPLAALPASSPLKHAPAPGTFQEFVFYGQSELGISFTCSDTYHVALIYPSTIDYRLNPLSALYNRAFPCTMNGSTTESISLVDRPFQASTTYYIVRAHQGKQGTWHGPY